MNVGRGGERLLVRRSTLIIESTQGKTKNRPGPFAPPEREDRD